MRVFSYLTAAAAIALLSIPLAHADRGFARVPKVKSGALELKVVSYDGATNGELTVEVRNPGKTAATFDAQGLYFIPHASADEAPQRLGAVGPLQIASGEGERWERKATITVAPGATIEAKLDVFCIDSHRASPTKDTGFTLAKDRMPVRLTQAIQADGAKAARGAGGYAAPAAKSAIQSEVWKNRDKQWVDLEGEGKQEVGKRR
jgi:hypothetical protein